MLMVSLPLMVKVARFRERHVGWKGWEKQPDELA